MLTKDPAGDVFETFGYDSLGRMTYAQRGTTGTLDAISRTEFDYDDLSRVVEERQRLFGETSANARTLEYSYDQTGNRLSLAFEAGNENSLALQYGYDVLNRNTLVSGAFDDGGGAGSVSQDLIRYTFDGSYLNNRSITTTYAYHAAYSTKDVVLQHAPSWDEHRRITQHANTTLYGGSAMDDLASYSYTLDKVGNRTSLDANRGTGSFADGFSKMRDASSVTYDGLHRLLQADYDGAADSEVLVYDDQGNRESYTNTARTGTTLHTYVNNLANEYTNMAGDTDVGYDANGNLTAEAHWSYTYDYDNHLKSIDYVDGGCQSQVASFEYDALGRMISSATRFDSDTDAASEVLKYYYDGQNAIAEYDTSNNLSRRHIHGTRYVDERAILLEGEADEADTYYYLLKDLYTVAGMMLRNGALAEAYVYDAYGQVDIWSYKASDSDRDGGVLPAELSRLYPYIGVGETARASLDMDMDGDTDYADMSLVNADIPHFGPTQLRVSGLGNPYFFTGRRLHFVEDDVCNAGLNPNRQYQYNRARHYDPWNGRWLQRDPIGYVDGMNLYEYVRSRPLSWPDPYGWYNMEWLGSGTWTDAKKKAVTDAIAGAKDRLATVLPKMDKNIKELEDLDCPDCYGALIEHVKLLRETLNDVKTDIASTTLNLEVRMKTLRKDVVASAWTGGFWHDHELNVNTRQGDNFFEEKVADQRDVVFHELTHLRGTEDSGDWWQNAHDIDELARMSWARFPYPRLEKVEADKKRKAGECCCPDEKDK